jgi:hypothetical protein
MLYLEANKRPLLLPAGTTAQVEHTNPLFADGLQDSYSLPVEVPAEGNEIALGHVHQLPLHQRTLELPGAQLGHHGLPLWPGILRVLSSTAKSVRMSFSVEGFVARLKGRMLPDTLRGLELPSAPTEPRDAYDDGGDFQYPMHYNPSLYGDRNVDWNPDSPEYSATATYGVNDLVRYTRRDPVERTQVWQCTAATSAGEDPISTPGKWRLTAFALVNAWDGATSAHYENDPSGNFYAFVPWFYIKWVLQRALASIGYRPVGEFMDDPATHELVLPNTTTLDRVNQQGDERLQASQTTDVYYTPGLATWEHHLPLDDTSTGTNEDPDSVWNAVTFEFTPAAAGFWKFRVKLTAINPYLSDAPNYGRAMAFALVRSSTNAVVAIARGAGPPAPAPLTVVATIAYEFELADVGDQFHLSVYQTTDLNGTSLPWPTSEEHGFSNARVNAWLEEVTAQSDRDPVVYPHRHVPEVEVGAFVVAVADALNLELTPDEATRTLRLDYKEQVLANAAANRTEQTHRLLEPDTTELDHQRRTPAYRLSWPLENLRPEEADVANAITVYSLLDLSTPAGAGQVALALSSREVYKSAFDVDTAAYYWQRVGLYTPPVTIGPADQAQDLPQAFEPLPMVVMGLDMRTYLVPVLDAPGESLWFHTQGERSKLWLCEYKAAGDSGDPAGTIPMARSWGYGWDGTDLSNLSLLWDDPSEDMPGLYQRYWRHWLHMLTTSEPVTMDLLVDPAYLRSQQWRRIHHIHGQDYLVQQLPVEYGSHRGQLMARGAYLLRVKGHPPLARLPEPTYSCEGPEHVQLEWNGPGVIGSSVSGATHVTVASNNGFLITVTAGTNVTIPVAGSYCMWPSDLMGVQVGYITELLLSGPTVPDPMRCEYLDISRLSLDKFYFFAATFGELTTVRWPGPGWNASVPGNIVVNATSQRLDQDSVNSLLNNLDPAIYADTVIAINGGTSAAPTGAAATVKTAINTAGGSATTN